MDTNDFFGEVIYSYTRAQAIEDGVLVDMSEAAKKTGFNFPVAVTSSVWRKYIGWNDEDSKRQVSQDENARLRDFLLMLLFSIKLSRNNSDQINYVLDIVPCDGKSRTAKRTQLKAIIGGGDDGEHVLTIMLPNED